MSSHPIDWTKVPHTELVSNSEDEDEIAEVKVGEKQHREEEVKAERRRQKEVHGELSCSQRGYSQGLFQHRCKRRKKHRRQRRLDGQKRPEEPRRSTGKRWCNKRSQCVNGRRPKGRR